MTPTVDAVKAHESKGGLWRAQFNGARVPIFQALTVHRGAVCVRGSCPESSKEFFRDLPGAVWVPVDVNGDKT